MRLSIGRSIGVLSCGLLVAAAAAQPDLLWIEQFGTSERDAAGALIPDGAGGIFVAGFTDGSLGGPNAGLEDAFLARHDGAGNQAWLTQFGTDSGDRALSLAPDGAGGIFVAGFTDGSLGGPSAGLLDGFIARYDGTGNQVWLTQFGGSKDDVAWALAPDGDGGVFVGGFTRGNLGGWNDGGYADAYVARYDGAGKQMWILQFGTWLDDWLLTLAPDGVGGVFAAGSTWGELGGQNFGDQDIFLARYDAAGTKVWIRQFGTGEWEEATVLTPDGEGGVFMAGWAERYYPDVFLSRHDAAGNQTWITQFGTKGDLEDSPTGLAPDGIGGVLVAGYTYGSLGGPNAGGRDAFLAGHDGAGNQSWITQFGTVQDEGTGALAPDGSGGVYFAGDTSGNLGGPNEGGGIDVYLARFGADCYGDCDSGGTLDLFDFLCFVNLFNAGDGYADCDGDGASDLFDFLCFVNLFNAGC